MKRFFFQYTHPVDYEVDDIYLIHKDNCDIIEIDRKFIKEFNNKFKYTNYLVIDDILPKSILNIDAGYLLEVKYRRHNKEYLINFDFNERKKPLLFPIYSLVEMKKINMNKITDIDGSEKLIKLLGYYGGPLNDFYISKDLGIKLKNIYDKDEKNFPFRNCKYSIGDIFLNEYNIGEDGETGENDVFIFKNSLDNTKLENNDNKEYILNNYKKLDMKFISWNSIKRFFVKEKTT